MHAEQSPIMWRQVLRSHEHHLAYSLVSTSLQSDRGKNLKVSSIAECMHGIFFLIQRREEEQGEQEEAMDAAGPGAKARAGGGEK